MNLQLHFRLPFFLLVLIPWISYGQITLTTNPGLSGGEIRLCLANGNQVSYTALYPGPNVTYAWTLPGATIGNPNGSGPFTSTYLNAGNFNSKVVVSVNGIKQDSSLFTVRVSNLQAPTFNPSQNVFCLKDGPFSLDGISPAGGVFTGPGVNGNIFNPLSAGVGTHTVTYTITDGNCTRSQTEQFTVNQMPIWNFSVNGITPSIFQGDTVFAHCTADINYSFFFLDNSSLYSSYTIDYGDGSPIVTGGSTMGVPFHNYSSPGLYTVTVSLTSPQGCVVTRSIKVFYGSNPGGQIVNTGNTTLLCTGRNGYTMTFPISGTQNNPSGTIYTIFFSDDNSITTFNHPPPASITHTFLNTSCGDTSEAFHNSYYVSFTATNPCGSSVPKIDPINLSSPPIPDFKIPQDTCTQDTVELVSISEPGSTVSYDPNKTNLIGNPGDYVCDTTKKIVWEISPNTYTVASGVLGNRIFPQNAQSWIPSGTDTVRVLFNRPGSYQVKQIIQGSPYCPIDSVTKSVCIDTVPSPKFALSDSAVCAGVPTNLYYLDPLLPYCDSTQLQWTIKPSIGWSINSGDLNDSSLSVSFNNTGTYQVILQASNPCGMDIDSVNVVVVGQPTLALPPDTTLCGLLTVDFSNPNSGYFFDDSAGTSSFTWSVTPDTGWAFLSGTDSSSAYPTIDFRSYGSYSINLNYSNSCFNRSGQMLVNVNKPPSINSPPDTIVCYDGSYIRSFNAQFGNHPLTYSWRAGVGSLNTGNNIQISNLKDTTRVWLFVEDFAGCRDSSSFRILIPDPISSTFNLANSVCYNQNTNVLTNVSGGIAPYSFQWLGSNTNYLSSDKISNPIIDSTGIPGTYVLRITDSLGCIHFDTLSVWQHPFTTVDAGPDESACNTVNNLPLANPSPMGGSWTGNFVNGQGIFDPQASGLGAHTVFYNFTDQFGCDYTDSLVVNVVAPPTASFTASDTMGCSVLNLNLSSTSDLGAQLQWYANDSLIGTNTNQNLSLVNPANTTDLTFEIKLVVSASGQNCTDSVTKIITVFPKPEANFTLPATLCANETISLSHSSSAKAIDSIRWIASSPSIIIADSSASPTDFTFPDNQSGSDSVYTISLIVYSTDGCSDTLNQDITIYSRPTASFSLPANACGPFTLQPADASTGPNLNYSWSISPSNNVIVTNLNTASPSFELPASSSDSVVYAISLIVTDDRGCADTTSQNFSLYPLPQADFNLSSQDSCGPLTVSFTNLSSSGQSGMDTSTMSFTWNLGNGSSFNGNTPPNTTYTNSGTNDTTFLVSLIATNAFGCSDTLLDSIIVRADPKAQLNFTNTVDCAPFTIDTSVVSAQGFASNDSYIWNILDLNGNLLSGPLNGINAINYTIANDGDSVIVQLITTNNEGCKNDTASQLFYTIEDPVANFAPLPQNGCSPLTVMLSDSSSAGVNHQWFLDGMPFSTLTNPSLILSNPSATQDATFDIRLLVTAGSGCDDDTTITITVFPKPQANFTLPTTLCANETISLSHSSSAKAIDSIRWIASSPSIIIADSSASPTDFTFPDNQSGSDSVYTISLIVYSTDGCSDTLNQDITIYSRPTASFSLPANACGPFTLQPADASTGPNLNYSWSISPSNNVIVTNLNTASPSFELPASSSDSVVYAISLIVTDDRGCADTTSQNFSLYPLPQADFNLSSQDSCGPLTVSFTNLSSSGQSGMDTSTMSFTWNLGNGSSFNGNTPPNTTYTNSGTNDTTFLVSLIATNAFGCSDTLLDSIIVRADPFAQMNISNSVDCAPFLLDSNAVKAVSYPPNGSYLWRILDLDSNLIASNNFSGQSGINYTISNDGDSVLVQLIVSNPFGCRNDTLTQLFYTIEDPVANFATLPQNGCSPLTVLLNDSSSAGVNHEWTVNGAFYSNAQSPSITLNNNSLTRDSMVTIQLVVTAGTGCTDTLEKTVTVHPKPQALFTLNANACANDTLSLRSLSNFKGNSLDSIRWIVSSSAVQIFDARADSTGILFPDNQSGVDSVYTVSLIVYSVDGCSDTLDQNITIFSRPSASFSVPNNACGPFVLQVSDSSAGPLLSYNWSITPPLSGSGLNSPNPSFSIPVSLSDSIVYRIALSITDANGCSDTSSQRFTLYPKPEGNFSLSQQDSCGPIRVHFANLSSSGQTGMDTATMSFSWNLGNGSTFIGNTPPPTTYTNNRIQDTTYLIQLITSNAFGCTDTLLDSVIVRADPFADFTSSTDLECAPFLVDTSIISWNDYPNINSTYRWEVLNLNDSLLAFGSDPNNINYTINLPADSVILRLIAFSPFGCKNDTLEKGFQTIPNPSPNFTILNPTGCSPHTLSILDSSSAGVTYEWFIDNQLVSASPSPNITLSNTGRLIDSVYTLKLIVTAGGTGCRDSMSQTVTVYALPEANFIVNPVCKGDSLSFTDLSTSIDTIVSWFWDFGDGNSDTSQFPTHTYTGYGWQTVTLTVSDSRGCNHSFSDSVLVYPNPIALIAKSGNCEPQNICKGQSVSLLDSSLVDSLGAPINSWSWDVDGDGQVDYNVQNPNHNFSDTGTTTVTLYVQTIYGCTDSISLSFTVIDLPTIDFDFDTIADCGPLTVNLQNNSTGRIDFSQWTIYTLDSLGNRQVMLSDTAQFLNTSINLLPSYRADTTYYFELASGNCCGSDTLTKSIRLKPLPVAAMLPSSVEGCTPFPVTFQLDGLVKGLPNYLVMNYGDGRIDTLLQNFIVNSNGDTIYVWGQQNHTFINPLNYDTTYTVSLTAVNDCGDSTVSFDILVHPNTVQAFFTATPINGCEDLDVSFQDFSFGGTNISWCFDYDTLSESCNQPVALGSNFNHRYTQAGTYVVAQFVDDGCSYDTAYQVITVYPAPQAAFNHNNFLCEGDTIFFNDQSLGNGGTISSYIWDFGDGDSSYLTSPWHIYDTAGVFQVKLLISSANGCKDSIFQTLTIYDKPEVDFGYSNACFNEQPILFSDSTTLSSGTIISTLWDFGDSNTSTSINPLHSYAAPGIYRVSLIKTSSNGCKDSVFYNVNVFPEPTADFNYQRLGTDSCSIPQTFDFVNLSQNAQGFLWDFDYSNNPGQFTSTLVNPQFTYNSYGVFEVALFTTNSFGCADTITKTIQVSPVPNAGFSVDTFSGCQPLMLNFRDTSSYRFNGPGGIVSWFWDFGDGNSSNEQNPSHVYTNFGRYQPMLIVTTDAGCYDTVLGTFIDVFPRPIANFEVQMLNAKEIQILNNSLNTDSATVYRWDLGDGTVSNEREPKHRYSFDLRRGDQFVNICLWLENAYSCADSLCLNLKLRSLQLNVPNALAPELNVGSDANVFLPKGHSLSSYTLRIYDKWGNIVFETSALDEEGKPSEPWDGTHYLNGTELPMGGYTWRIDAVFNDGSIWTGKDYDWRGLKNVGSVTLIR